MKKIFTIAVCLLMLSCKHNPGDVFIGNWTDGTWRHISIRAAKAGYIIVDISKGNRKFFATYTNDELIVRTNNGISLFNYIKGTDEILAGAVNFHRETAKKDKPVKSGQVK